MRKHVSPLLFISLGVLTLFFALGLFFVVRGYQEDLDDLKNQRHDEFEYQVEASINHYSSFADYLFERHVNQDEVLSIVHQALNADEATRDSLRDALHDKLEEDYRLMTDYEFRQLHFHFPDSTSFLRMHQVEAYGDSLLGVRYSVDEANRTLEKQVGFEEGRIFNGYRHVYPLFYEDTHIGSVEVSITLTTVLKSLTAMYPERDYYWIIERNVVEGTVFEDFQDYYQDCFVCDNFLFDNESVDAITLRNVISFDDFSFMMGRIQEDQTLNLLDYKPYFFLESHHDERYEVLFNPLQNIEGESIGYFISVIKSNDFVSMRNQHWVNISMATIIYITTMIMVATIIYSRTKMKYSSETDYLTDISNRRKFFEQLEKEFARYKRHKIPFTLVMFDIDDFKKINDVYGHSEGDLVLQTISKLVRSQIRVEDTLARIGGEEFMMILTACQSYHGYIKAETLRVLLSELTFKKVPKVTLSFGIAEVKEDDTIEELLHHVDQALYKAKMEGKNQSIMYEKIKEKRSL